MSGLSDGRVPRFVRIVTEDGSLEGTHVTGTALRTLDDLNSTAQTFFTVRDVRFAKSAFGREAPAVAVNKESILFLAEPTEDSGVPPPVALAGRHERAAVLLAVGGYRIRGDVHVPAGGQPFPLLDRREPRFVALTSAMIDGPEGVLEAPFVAVRRDGIRFLREIFAV